MVVVAGEREVLVATGFRETGNDVFMIMRRRKPYSSIGEFGVTFNYLRYYSSLSRSTCLIVLDPTRQLLLHS